MRNISEVKYIIPENRMLNVFRDTCVVWLVLFFAVVFAATAQQAPKYAPTEVQQLKLQIKQKDYQLAYYAAENARQAYVKAVQDYNGYAEEVKRENKWPDGVRFDMNSGTFVDPPTPPPAPAPAPVPTEKKP